MVATVTFQDNQTVIVHDESIECKQHFGHLPGYKDNSIELDYKNYNLLTLLLRYLLGNVSVGNIRCPRYTQIENGAAKLDKIALQAEQLGRVKYPEDAEIPINCIKQLSTLEGTLEAYQTFKKQGLIADKSAWSQSNTSKNLSNLLKIRSLEIIQSILRKRHSERTCTLENTIHLFVNNSDSPLAHNRNQLWQNNPTGTQIAVTAALNMVQGHKAGHSAPSTDPISAQIQALRNK